jgi:hypothetical protein
MWKHAVQLLLGLFILGNGGLVYTKALTMFQDKATTMPDWISLSIGAIFLLVPAMLVYEFGSAGFDYLAALVPTKKAEQKAE